MGERMTREEEIKAKLEKEDAVYLDCNDSYDTRAEDDIRYLLARNEELQRRVEKVEKALQFYARLDSDMEYDEIEEDHGRRALGALDAKEQDDD